MGEDFRGFLKEMEETQEGGFIRIKKEVDRRYEAAAIVKKLEQERKVPLIIFKNIKGKSLPVAVNCNGTRGRVARALGVPKTDLEKTILHAYKNPISPVEISDGPVHEIVLKGKDIDVTRLPGNLSEVSQGRLAAAKGRLSQVDCGARKNPQAAP